MSATIVVSPALDGGGGLKLDEKRVVVRDREFPPRLMAGAD